MLNFFLFLAWYEFLKLLTVLINSITYSHPRHLLKTFRNCCLRSIFWQPAISIKQSSSRNQTLLHKISNFSVLSWIQYDKNVRIWALSKIVIRVIKIKLAREGSSSNHCSIEINQSWWKIAARKLVQSENKSVFKAKIAI